MTTTPTWARQPRQARSQRTLDALLDAAEALLAQRPYHAIALTEIIANAGSSAGSFYARFADKQALLHALHERLAERTLTMSGWLHTAAGRLLATGGGATDANARAVARLVIGNIVRGHLRNRGVLRAVAIDSFRDPRFTARALHVTAAMRDVACAALRPFRGSRTPEQFDETVAFALRMVLATLDQQLFVPPSAQEQLASDDATLGAKLADAFIRYLQLASFAPS